MKVTDSLIPFDYNYLFPYVTISYASGQWFLTSVFETYSRQVKSKSISKHGKIGGGGGGDGGEGNRGIGEGEVVRVMMDTRKEFERDGKWIFFTQEGGGSWVGWDNYFFAWVGDWWFLIVLGSVGLGGAWWWWRGRRGGYRKVDGEDKGDA